MYLSLEKERPLTYSNRLHQSSMELPAVVDSPQSTTAVCVAGRQNLLTVGQHLCAMDTAAPVALTSPLTLITAV
jgi:hypothetical protein